MKLKLHALDDVQILTVTEDVEAAHVAVLRAGILKITKGTTKKVVYDLTHVGSASAEVLQSIAGLRSFALQQGAQLLIVSSAEGVGDGSTIDEVVAKFAVGGEEKEGHLKQVIAALKAEKEKMDRQLEEVSKSGLDTNTLKRENSDRQWEIKSLEAQITSLLRMRKSEPVELDPKIAEIAKLLDDTIANEKLLKEVK